MKLELLVAAFLASTFLAASGRQLRDDSATAERGRAAPRHAQTGGEPVEEGMPERLARVSTDVLLTRAAAIDPDPEIALPALKRLGLVTTDAVTEELLVATYRGRDDPRRREAATALLAIGERMLEARDLRGARRIGEGLWKSALGWGLRDRAAALMNARAGDDTDDRR